MNSTNDTYILRLTNWSVAETAANPVVTLDANNNEFTVKVPERLRAKGKCKLTVVGGTVMLEEYAAAGRITPDDARYLELISNIPFLGYDVETTGTQGITLVESEITDNTQVAVSPPLANVGGPVFTVPQLPPQITCKKFYLNAASARVAAQVGGELLPVEVILQLEFFEDIQASSMVHRAIADRSANDHNNQF